MALLRNHTVDLQALIGTAAAELGIDQIFLEKEFWVIDTCRQNRKRASANSRHTGHSGAPRLVHVGDRRWRQRAGHGPRDGRRPADRAQVERQGRPGMKAVLAACLAAALRPADRHPIR
jgi:hypothetical protein